MNRAYHGLLTVGIAAAALAVLVLPGKVDSREPRVRRRSPRPVTVAPAPTVFPDLPNPIAPAPEGFPGKVIGTWGKVAFVWVDGEGFVVEVKEEFRGWRLEACDAEGAVFGNGSSRLRVPITAVRTPQEPILDEEERFPIEILPHLCEPLEGITIKGR